MNGGLTECIVCDCDPCACKEIRARKNREVRATEILKTFDTQTNELYQVLIKPKGLRQRLLRWLYPEITKVADSLRECYWSK